MKIAIVGGGISGLSAAWMLAREHEVTLYEAADRLGGHANTVDIELDGRKTPVDTGFIVYNEHNYPNLTRLFDALGVTTEASDMSFAVSLAAGARFIPANALSFRALSVNLAWKAQSSPRRTASRKAWTVAAGPPGLAPGCDASSLADPCSWRP